MSAEFDPYRRWLGIPPHEQPPHHYRLLGIGVFEDDPDVIEEAADRQMSHVQTHKTGQYSALSQKLLNELSAAKLCLLNPDEKNAYDAQLRAQLLTPRGPAPRDEAASEGDAPTFVAAPLSEMPQVETPLQVAVSAPATMRVAERRRNVAAWKQPAIVASAGVALAAAIGIGALILARGKVPVAADDAASVSRPQPQSPQAKPSPRIAPALVKVKKTQAAVRPTIGAVPTTPKGEPSQTVDLLKLIDVARDSVAGSWRFDGSTLVAPAVEFARLQIPYAPPDEYELQIVLEKPPIFQGIIVALPVDGVKHGLLVLDMGVPEGAISLLALEGVNHEDNRTVHRGLVLIDDKPNEVSILVRKSGIQVDCNDARIIDWAGERKQLADQDAWSFPDKTQLGIGCWNIEHRITKLALRPLDRSPAGN